MYDLLVIGGGINGAGIARDAAGRGLKVLLCEKQDFAQHTSSASTKLIHGGLRYLEHYEFRLVREALIEREVLLRAAPHIIWPLRFILPYDAGLRPAWMLRLGLFLYDNLGGRKLLPGTKRVPFKSSVHGDILQSRLKFGFEYSDCWVQDSRLVVLNACDAQAKGADIHTRTACMSLDRRADHWVAKLKPTDGDAFEVQARAVVNSAGPWVDDIIRQVYTGRNVQNVRLVKGSHIVTRKLYDGDHCYIFQNADDRIIFAIPYEGDYTLVGTTDESFSGDPKTVEISDGETDYIIDSANEYFKTAITRDDIVWTYSGVRPLYDDQAANNSTITRDYVFDLDVGEGKAPILAIFGGKITTYRKLAEHALEKLESCMDIPGGPWTRDASLPGGDILGADFDGFLKDAAAEFPWLPRPLLHRLARNYGTQMPVLLAGATSLEALGRHFGADLYEAELAYLRDYEFALSGDDALWRRSKLGLKLSQDQRDQASEWFGEHKARSAKERATSNNASRTSDMAN